MSHRKRRRATFARATGLVVLGVSSSAHAHVGLMQRFGGSLRLAGVAHDVPHGLPCVNSITASDVVANSRHRSARSHRPTGRSAPVRASDVPDGEMMRGGARYPSEPFPDGARSSPAMPFGFAGRQSGVEFDAYLVVLPPYDMAAPSQRHGRTEVDDESLRDCLSGGKVKASPHRGRIADLAFDLGAVGSFYGSWKAPSESLELSAVRHCHVLYAN